MPTESSLAWLWNRLRSPLGPPRTLLSSGILLLTLAACSSKEDAAAAVDEAEVVPASEEEAREVEARFEGVFTHQVTLQGETLETTLELSDEGIRQRKMGLVVFEAACARTVQTRRRVSFECTEESGKITRWPMEIDAEGRLFHRAQPELLFLRAEGEE